MKTPILFGFAVFSCIISLAFMSCNQDTDDEENTYQEATAKVDYNGTGPNSKRAVFFKFSNGTMTELPLDFFDIAISTNTSLPAGQPRIIANSGSYGAGVLTFKTDHTNIADSIADPSVNNGVYPNPDGGSPIVIRHVTFRNDYDVSPPYIPQSVANPLAAALANPAAADGKVYAIKTGTGKWFKVTFTSFGPMGQYSITVVEGLSGTVQVQISGSLSAATPYGYIYIDLDEKKDVTTTAGIPKADEWDILCTRTDDILNQGSGTAPVPYYANRSSILINSAQGVTAAKVEGDIESVLSVPGAGAFSSKIDAAIGYGWYSSSGMPPTNTVNNNTYVVKTVEGNYAKFQPGTFYGPGNESFYMTFRYWYQGDGAETFD